jgi:hypothetical protein
MICTGRVGFAFAKARSVSLLRRYKEKIKKFVYNTTGAIPIKRQK